VLAGIVACALIAGLLTARAGASSVFVDGKGALSLGLGGAGLPPGVARPAPRELPVAPTTNKVIGPPATTGSFMAVHLAAGRGYVMHLPPAPAEIGGRRPLVIVLHGMANTWRMIAETGGWAGYADTHGFLVAFGIGRYASWNAGRCCGMAQARHVDDVDYLVSVVDDAAARYAVDRSRVYVVGFSAGDMMAMRAECERPDVFAAAGGAAGTLVAPCHPGPYQVRIRQLHGRYDAAVPYPGGHSALLRMRFAPAQHLAVQAAAAGSPAPAVAVTGLPCGHVWPTLRNACQVDGTDLIWRWMSPYRRPLPGDHQPQR
jgi:poly(3-hydroxybutyrate) depolymerase